MIILRTSLFPLNSDKHVCPIQASGTALIALWHTSIFSVHLASIVLVPWNLKMWMIKSTRMSRKILPLCSFAVPSSTYNWQSLTCLKASERYWQGQLSYHKSGQTRVDLEQKGYNWQRWKIRRRKSNQKPLQ